MSDRRVLTADQAKEIGVDPNYFGDCSDAVLLTTRGGNVYARRSWRRLCDRALAWRTGSRGPITRRTAFCLTATTNVDLHPQELRTTDIAIGSLHAADGRVCVGTRIVPRGRIDHQATLVLPPGRPPMSAGRWCSTCRPAPRVVCESNCRTPKGGPCRVSRWQIAGKIIGDEIEQVVVWRDSSELKQFAGRPVRIRFKMTDADVYAFRVR